MRVVLDTNVLISGLLNPDGTPAQILNLLLNGKITVLHDSRIMKEYKEVVNRKKFGFKQSVLLPLLDYIEKDGEHINAEPSKISFVDEDDKMFYEAAITAKAECIITGNKDHYPDEEMIKSPKEFIDFYLSRIEEQK